MEETKQIDTITIIIIFMATLFLCMGMIGYEGYKLEKRVHTIEENAISKQMVGTMCLNENCTISTLIVNTNKE